MSCIFVRAETFQTTLVLHTIDYTDIFYPNFLSLILAIDRVPLYPRKVIVDTRNTSGQNDLSMTPEQFSPPLLNFMWNHSTPCNDSIEFYGNIPSTFFGGITTVFDGRRL